MRIPTSFFLQKDVVSLSKQLIGKVLCSNIDGEYASGIITETEAYNGVIDKASHAYNNRRTSRTEVMYSKGGVSYVYLCYGIHYLFNVVSNETDIPHAVLIRGILPLEGITIIQQRRNLKRWDKKACIGPGKVSQALGINKTHNAISLNEDIIWLEDRKIKVLENEIIAGPRVGVDYAEEDALLPYRFQYLKDII